MAPHAPHDGNLEPVITYEGCLMTSTLLTTGMDITGIRYQVVINVY
jgi:hypothetical protein